MSKKILYVLGILVTLALASFAQWKYMCSNCDKSDESTDLSTMDNGAKALPMNGFSFSNDGVGFICNDNFNFEANGYKSKLPIGDSIDIGINELKDYLDTHPNDKARIVGKCISTEENTSAFPNLGMARANHVKNYLLSKGIPANRLDMTGVVVETWDKSGNVVKGPIIIDIINTANVKTVNWTEFRRKLNESPLLLAFNSGEASIALSVEQREMIANLSKYLDNNEGSMISIVGHTDNLGDRNANIRLGLERAEFAKAYLAKNGVSADRIEASSKGPDQPIADNSLESGRAKNRRTLVLLK
jgi:outer membrane protein OmpA-like peptidoglycan-associated protein